MVRGGLDFPKQIFLAFLVARRLLGGLDKNSIHDINKKRSPCIKPLEGKIFPKGVPLGLIDKELEDTEALMILHQFLWETQVL